MAAKKKRAEKIDGLSEDDKRKLRSAIRQVWSWSYPRRLCVQRATNTITGFATCETCAEVVAKVFPDHIEAVGKFGPGFIERMFVPSHKLQALCKKCHARKTREDKKSWGET